MIRLALIGCGNWSKVLEANLPENVEIDVRITCRKQWNRHITNKKAWLQDHFDALLIANSIETRNTVINDIIDTGLNIPLYVEKPVATDLKTAARLLEYGKENVVFTGHQDLARPSIIELNEKANNRKWINIAMGDNTQESSYSETLWDWGPHAIAISYFLLNSNIHWHPSLHHEKSVVGIIGNSGKSNVNILLSRQFKNSIRMVEVGGSFWHNNNQSITAIINNDYQSKEENAVKINLQNFVNSIKYKDKGYLKILEIAVKSVAAIINLESRAFLNNENLY